MPILHEDGLTFHAPPKPLVASAVTHDWRDFLGPSHNALSTESPLRETPKLVWERVKGEGYASPCAVAGKVIVFHRLAEQEVVECVAAETGKRVWKSAYAAPYSDRYGFSAGPRCQPISDGKFVYTYGVTGKLTCLALATGQVVWKRDIAAEYKVPQNYFGVGATPLLEGNLLIVVVGKDAGPSVVAFDKATGKQVWAGGKGWTAGYASPIAATVHGQRRIFAFLGGDSQPTQGGLLCLEAATGKVHFTFPWRARRYESVNASTPVVIGNQVFLSECYGMGGTLLDLKPDGTFTQLWTNKRFGMHFMTAIHKNGYLYGIDGHGPQNAPLVCVELKTGKELWREEPEWEVQSQGKTLRLAPALASLIAFKEKDRCLMMGEYGQLAWLELSPKGYKELSRSSLFVARESWGTPALSRGLLTVCQNETGVDGTPRRVLCFDLRGGERT
ncbi:PQQ-binding-like beta-propeller repeat protein [Armatimonas sp.]|uniref:PQQ-binding-like beta-propeller repeat protein n=1 Tax=Armatimonas sp. TaxID=1872638 RepID=UPI00286CDD54|nr:PQQ-binding-like beta-propeller repeat protein [Armatimonas sp.]